VVGGGRESRFYAVFGHKGKDVSIRAMANVFERQDIKSPTERFVLLALTDHASEDGENIYPSVATVCLKTGFTERTVQAAIKSLVGQGILVHVGKGRHLTNKYRYIFATPAGDAPPHMDAHTPAFAAPLPPQMTAFTPAGDAPESLINHHIKPSSKSSFPNETLKPMVFVLEKTTGIDSKIGYGKLASFAKKLLFAGYSPELVARIYSSGGLWFRKDWRGAKGQRPKPSDICDTIMVLSQRDDDNDPQRYVKGDFAEFIEH